MTPCSLTSATAFVTLAAFDANLGRHPRTRRNVLSPDTRRSVNLYAEREQDNSFRFYRPSLWVLFGSFAVGRYWTARRYNGLDYLT